MTDYFVAPDANGEPTLWRGRPRDRAPSAILTKHELREAPEVWDAIVSAYLPDPWLSPEDHAALEARIATRLAEPTTTEPPF
jgi:hypothetical protein